MLVLYNQKWPIQVSEYLLVQGKDQLSVKSEEAEENEEETKLDSLTIESIS